MHPPGLLQNNEPADNYWVFVALIKHLYPKPLIPEKHALRLLQESGKTGVNDDLLWPRFWRGRRGWVILWHFWTVVLEVSLLHKFQHFPCQLYFALCGKYREMWRNFAFCVADVDGVCVVKYDDFSKIWMESAFSTANSPPPPYNRPTK